MNKYKLNYSKFIDPKLSLNDQLSAARSIMANEQTFLSYQRSALTFVITGLSFIKLFDLFWLHIFGIILIVAAVITGILGVLRYSRMRSLIINLELDGEFKE
ncbi:MAG: DUF202 domain-containing protein [Candidatus Kapabacteria bacterium]|nr:DUF202 domain-containing protein [Candidatus Kapabacteria bacterium]